MSSSTTSRRPRASLPWPPRQLHLLANDHDRTSKGVPSHAIPADKPFPFPYRDDFESYKAGETPRYFSEQKGTFEVCDEPGHGKCLKQIVPQQGIMWQYMPDVAKPYTVLGDQRWKDYTLSADVRIAGGDVELGGRFGDQNRLSYRWILAKDGSWKLNYQKKILASGTIQGFEPSAWHAMKLVLRGTTIRGMIDGRSIAEVTDSSRMACRTWPVPTTLTFSTT